MPIPIQNAESSQALAAALGLKGAVRLQVDETEVPVIVTQFLPATPYTTVVPIGGSGALGAGGAGVFAGISISAGRGGILVIDLVEVNNTSASDGDFSVRIQTPADIAAVTTAATRQAFNFNSPFDGGGVRTTGALIRDITHTAILGATIRRLSILDNTMTPLIFPGGYALYGDDPLGPQAMCLWNTVGNEGVSVNFFGKVYLNKG